MSNMSNMSKMTTKMGASKSIGALLTRIYDGEH